MELETTLVHRIEHTRYRDFMFSAMAELANYSMTDPLSGWIPHSAVVASVEAGPVGIMAFRYDEGYRIVVDLAYVVPDYRRRGIFGHIYNELVKFCERAKRPVIEFEVPIQNAKFGEMLVGVGASLVTQRYRIETEF